MKILLISPFIYPFSTGGMEIYNFYFAKELKKLGINVSILSNNSKKIPIDLPQFRLCTKNTLIRSVQIFWHLLLHKYDIVHSPYVSNFFLAYPLTIFKLFFRKNNYVIYIHGGGMHKWKNEKIQKLFFNKAKEIISVSNPIKYEYEKRINREITTVLPLIPFEESKKSREQMRDELGINEDEKVIIYIGSIKPIKGSDFLVNSFVKLGIEFFNKNNLRMIFIGDGILKNELEQIIQKHNMNNEIVFLGRRKKEEVQDYLMASDLFIFASQFEGTPLSLLEAMYNKLLVVATDVTGINNIIQHKVNGLLYKKEDFESFKQTLEYALQNNAECNKMADYAKNITLKNFDYQKNILEHLRLYAQ